MSNYIDILSQSFHSSFEREVCILYTKEHGFFSFRTDDQWGRVEFDFERVWELLMLSQFESITMIHTHPPGVNQMSETDHNLVKSWSMGLGKPIHFCILPESIDYLVYNYIERENKKTIVHDTQTVNLVINKPLRLLQETMLYFSQGLLRPTKSFLEIEKEISQSQSLKNSMNFVMGMSEDPEGKEETEGSTCDDIIQNIH